MTAPELFKLNIPTSSVERGRMVIARFFKARRLASGLTLQQVSEALRLRDPEVVRRYEVGEIGIPLDDIFALTNLLNVPPEEVMALIFQISTDQ